MEPEGITKRHTVSGTPLFYVGEWGMSGVVNGSMSDASLETGGSFACPLDIVSG